MTKFLNEFDCWTKRDIHEILSDSWTACCVVVESAFKMKLTQKSCSSKKWFQKFDQKSKTKMNDGHCGSFVSKLVNKPLETF